MERDCEHCFHKVPVFDEEGYCKYAECDSWDCEYMSRADAKKAIEESALQYAKGYQDGFLEAKKQFERSSGDIDKQ